MEAQETLYRVCSKCHESKPLDAVHFPPGARCRHGLQSVCRVCKRAHLNQYNAAKRAQSKEQKFRPLPARQERACTKCGESKPLDAVFFAPHPLSRDGLTPWCRDCQRVYSTEHARKNRDRRNEQKKARRRANPEKAKADRERYYQMYKEKEQEYNRAWRARNPDYFKRFEQYYREQRLNYQRQRRALFKRLMPLADAAVLIGVKEATVRVAVREKRIASVTSKKQCFVFREEAQAWKERREKGPQVKPTFSLDAAKEGCGSFHEWIADPNALNPLQAVLMQESVNTLLAWVASELEEEEQTVLLTYADSAFDTRAVASALNKPVQTVQSIIARVQLRATQTFGKGQWPA